MYNLCSQHVQSLNSIQQKLFVLQPLKDMFQMRPSGEGPGKVPNDPPALLSRDGSDGCLEVRDGLEVVIIHPDLDVTSQIEVWGVQV